MLETFECVTFKRKTRVLLGELTNPALCFLYLFFCKKRVNVSGGVSENEWVKDNEEESAN